MYRLNVQVTAYGRQTVPDRGLIWSCYQLQNFGAPIISLEWLNLVVKFCTRVGYINSMQQDNISLTKGRGYGHVIVLKFCRLSWCSTSRGFVSDSWATCLFLVFLLITHAECTADGVRYVVERVCLFVHALKGKWLKLAAPKSVDI